MIAYLIIAAAIGVGGLYLLGALPEESTIWIVGVSISLLSAYSMRDLPAVWRGRSRSPLDNPYEIPEWWPFGDALWRAMVRDQLALPFMVFAGLVLPLAQTETTGALAAAELLIRLGAGITLVLATSIALVNRPRLLVPPHLREFPGALAEWFGEAGVPSRADGWNPPRVDTLTERAIAAHPALGESLAASTREAPQLHQLVGSEMIELLDRNGPERAGFERLCVLLERTLRRGSWVERESVRGVAFEFALGLYEKEPESQRSTLEALRGIAPKLADAVLDELRDAKANDADG